MKESSLFVRIFDHQSIIKLYEEYNKLKKSTEKQKENRRLISQLWKEYLELKELKIWIKENGNEYTCDTSDHKKAFNKWITNNYAKLENDSVHIFKKEERDKESFYIDSREDIYILSYSLPSTKNPLYIEFVPKNTNLSFIDKDMVESLKLLCIVFGSELTGQTNCTAISSSKSEDSFEERIAELVHEFRSPLNGIVGFSDILLELEKNPEQKNYIEMIKDSSNTLLRLVNDLLDVAKLNSGKFQLSKQKVNLLLKFIGTVSTFTPSVKSKNIKYYTYIDPSIPRIINTDAFRISQVLTNLISNAVKFTPENGSIFINIVYNSKKNKIKISVKDTGIGLSEEQQNKIFSKYEQAESSTSTTYGGTGLGLAICQSILELYGSKLNVKSRLNKGSEFSFEINFDEDDIVDSSTLVKSIKGKKDLKVAILNSNSQETYKKLLVQYLKDFEVNFNEVDGLDNLSNHDILFILDCDIDPKTLNGIKSKEQLKIYILRADDCNAGNTDIYNKIDLPLEPAILSTILDQKEKNNKQTQSTPTNIDKLSVLLVDDSPINIRLLSATLKKIGIKADMAFNGFVATEKYKSRCRQNRPYDLILMDEHMPKMSGAEAANSIRDFEKENGVEKKVKIISITGSESTDIDKVRLDGFDDYLPKPVDIKKLIDTVNNIKQKD